MPSSNGSSTAARTASIAFSQASKPRNLRAFALRTPSKISGLPRAGAILSSRSRTRRNGMFSSIARRAKASAPLRNAPSSTSASTTPHAAACLAPNGVPERITSSATSGPISPGNRCGPPAQPVRAAGARNEAELDFGQAELGGGDRDAIVAEQRDLEAAAQRRAVDRSYDRLRRALDRALQLLQRRALRRFAEFGNVRADN